MSDQEMSAVHEPATATLTSATLRDRVAIITGAGRGLGRAYALRLAADGARVVVNDVGGPEDDLHSGDDVAGVVTDQIRALGGDAVPSRHDVADWDQAGEVIDLAVREFGALHVLVNNAGVVSTCGLADMTQAEWDRVVRVHLDGHAGPTHHALRYWRQVSTQGRQLAPSVVNISSDGGLFPRANVSHYDTAKLGLIAFTRAVAQEGAPWGVRSNALLPLARTRMWRPTDASADAPDPPSGTRQLDDPDDIAPVVSWLADASCPANGQILYAHRNRLWVLNVPDIRRELHTAGRWTPEQLHTQLTPHLVDPIANPATPHRLMNPTPEVISTGVSSG